MKYDPIKRSLGSFFNTTPFLRITFYKMLDLLLLRTWHIKKELRKLQNSNSNAISILDAGSGYGQYSYYMSQLFKNSQITGVDVKEEQIADCNIFFNKLNLHNVTFAVGDLTKHTQPNTYNLILSVDVMEHIEEDVVVFKNFFNSLKDKGVLLISTPSDQGGSDVHNHDTEESFIDEHVRDGYSINDITHKLTSVGFSNISVKYQYGFWGKISWTLSMKLPIKMLNISKIFFLVIPFYYLLTFPISLIFNYFDVSGTNKTGTGLIVKAYK